MPLKVSLMLLYVHSHRAHKQSGKWYPKFSVLIRVMILTKLQNYCTIQLLIKASTKVGKSIRKDPCTENVWLFLEQNTIRTDERWVINARSTSCFFSPLIIVKNHVNFWLRLSWEQTTVAYSHTCEGVCWADWCYNCSWKYSLK